MLCHIIGYDWRSDRNINFIPGLKLRKVINGVEQDDFFYPLIKDRKFISIIIDGQYCIGFRYAVDAFHKCKGFKKINGKGIQCKDCARLDLIRKCLMCTGKICINPLSKKICEKTEHVVYLASFDNIIKVGTSMKKRFKKRMIEQAAAYGLIIANVSNGYLARKIEEDIASLNNLKKRIGIKIKLNTLFNEINTSNLALMENYYKLIKKDLIKYKRYLVSNSTFFKNMIIKKKKDVVFRPILYKIKKNYKLEARIKSVKGSFLLLYYGNIYVVVNLKKLSGWIIDLQ